MLESLLRRATPAPPKPDQTAALRWAYDRLAELSAREDAALRDHMERVCELAEARQMAGSGPWTIGPAVLEQTDALIKSAHEAWRSREQKLREATPLGAQGAFGDIELALQNIEWRREVQLSWLEFSRWGIQQIILYTRLNYIKNPVIRRLIDVCAAYVFARGVEVSSSEPDANEILKDFFERNRQTIGQNALVDLERRKDYDGNIFHVLFADAVDSGLVAHRTIDATEIDQIVCDPEDSERPWFYKRVWSARTFDVKTGATGSVTRQLWYPALGYDPPEQPDQIGSVKVEWGARVYHRKAGAVSKWTYGCPRGYPALDWAKENRKYLEACASTAQSLSQIAMTLTTKGGQQAIEGAKQQLQSTVGPSAAIWDTNPTAVAGSTFASGPGTKLEAFKAAGAGQDPEKCRQYKLMCCMVFGVPETFLSDVSTGNLATATSLDRPTETIFLERQESWREDLVVIGQYVLGVSLKAQSGQLREAFIRRGVDPEKVRIIEAQRKRLPSGRMVYLSEAERKPSPTDIEIKADFPAIREGDQLAQMQALEIAATFGNKAGQFIGTDEKATIGKAYDICDIDGGAELVELQYPSTGKDKYDPNRLIVPLPAPLQKLKPQPGGQPQDAPAQVPSQPGEQTPNSAAAGVPQTHSRETWIPIAEDGGWVTINGRPIQIGTAEENLSEKAKRALAAMNKCGADKQRIADKSEAKLSKALGIPRTRDNSAFDLRNDDVGIEIKTMVDGKNDKITMSKSALGRKIAESQADDLKTFTVVADVRGGGAAKYYVSEKLGSIRLGSMTPISLSDLRTMVRNP